MKKDITGQVFGRLTAMTPVGSGAGGVRWRCICSCGKESVVSCAVLISGATRSCGCLREELRGSKQRTHGMTKTPTYVVWQAMRARCYYEKHPHYSNYGGRGIAVCDEWKDSFENFLADMGPRPEGKTLDRKDSNGDYCKGNCKWATRREQNRNSKQNRAVIHLGESKCLSEWCEILGLDYMKTYYQVTRNKKTLQEVLDGCDK